MIIGIDGNEANVREKVGVSVYTLKLLEYFQRHARKDLRFIVYLKKLPNVDLPDENENYRYKVVPGPFLWSQLFLPLELMKNMITPDRIGVFFSPAHYAPRLAPCPTVVTVHDVAFIHFPEEFLSKDLYQLKNWTRYSIRKAKKIISVSKATKKDVVSSYGIPEEKIEVIYNGFEKNVEVEEAVAPNPKIDPPYVLYVGTIQPRKNIVTLIRAFKLINNIHPEYKLVITGKKGWLFDKIFKEARDLYLSNKIVFTGYVSDEELVYLYKHAFCFVLPSLYEGFGIPLLEAMSFSAPVISSFSSSLPEVGGEAALYFDPQDYKDLSHKLEILHTDRGLRTELISKGSKRIRQFSWDSCAKKTLEVLIRTSHEKG